MLGIYIERSPNQSPCLRSSWGKGTSDFRRSWSESRRSPQTDHPLWEILRGQIHNVWDRDYNVVEQELLRVRQNHGSKLPCEDRTSDDMHALLLPEQAKTPFISEPKWPLQCQDSRSDDVMHRDALRHNVFHTPPRIKMHLRFHKSRWIPLRSVRCDPRLKWDQVQRKDHQRTSDWEEKPVKTTCSRQLRPNFKRCHGLNAEMS